MRSTDFAGPTAHQSLDVCEAWQLQMKYLCFLHAGGQETSIRNCRQSTSQMHGAPGRDLAVRIDHLESKTEGLIISIGQPSKCTKIAFELLQLGLQSQLC
jgi:hypothetical protein